MTLDDTPTLHHHTDAAGRRSMCPPSCLECARVRAFGRREAWVDVFNLAEDFARTWGRGWPFGSFLAVLNALAEKAKRGDSMPRDPDAP